MILIVRPQNPPQPSISPRNIIQSTCLLIPKDVAIFLELEITVPIYKTVAGLVAQHVNDETRFMQRRGLGGRRGGKGRVKVFGYLGFEGLF
jgi:hypothetical protein